MSKIYTIGHSTYSVDILIGLLKLHEVTALGDVRSSPYSRYNPQFNREDLKTALKVAGIQYVYLGAELGGRSANSACYENGKVSYELLAKTKSFQDGLQRVQSGIHTYRIALMCAEKDPLFCHRGVLVSRFLVERGLNVQHILEGGRLQTHDWLVERLLRKHALSADDFFRSREEAMKIAYERQGEEIAYSEQQPNSPGQERA